MLIIDGENAILGRLASEVAKKLLEGENVIIVNAEKVVVSGDRQWLIKFFKQRRDRGIVHFGPFYPKRSDRIVFRAIRGMLPYKKERGRKALRRLKVFLGVPEQYKNVEKVKIGEYLDKLHGKFTYLEDISKQL